MSDDPQPTLVQRLGTLGALSILGLALSISLIVVHVQTHLRPAADSFCTLGASFDCASVAASPHAIFLGVPWAIWGALLFLTLTIASWNRSLWLLPLTTLAAVGSVALLFVSLLLVGSICFLCEGVHLVSLTLAALSWRKRAELSGSFGSLEGALDLFALPAGILLALVLFLPPYWGSFNYKAEPPFATGTTKEGHPWIGSEKPEKVIHEFVDYRCPYCRVASARTLRHLKANPTWRLVRRQHPGRRCSSKHKYSCIEVRLALCAADQGKFWRADRWLFSHPNPGVGPDSQKLAKALSLDETKFLECVSSEDAFQRAQASYELTIQEKIKDTPGYTVDGKRLKQEDVTRLFD